MEQLRNYGNRDQLYDLKHVGLRRGRDDAHKMLCERSGCVGPGADGDILHLVSI